MSCRCSEIAKCNKDISTLNKMINELTQLEQEDISINKNLDSFAEASGECITPQNINELMSCEKKLNKPISNLRSQMLGDCVSERDRLKKVCKSLESEDTDYHSEEEDKKNNK